MKLLIILACVFAGLLILSLLSFAIIIDYLKRYKEVIQLCEQELEKEQ